MANRAMLPREALLFAVCTLLAACSWCKPKPSLPSGFELPVERPPGLDRISDPIVILADNQQHHLHGRPFWLRSFFADRVRDSAIRPVQLDLFGPELLRWTLKNEVRSPVVHLGDALDISCEQEMDRFLEIMKEMPKNAAGPWPWVMAPGNHDGYFYGNFSKFPNDDWDKACTDPKNPTQRRHLGKDRFIRRYLDVLREQSDPGCRFLASQDTSVSSGEVRYKNEKNSAFLLAVAWHIDEDQPWRSFIVQEVNLNRGKGRPVIGLIVDTSSYRDPPTPAGVVAKRAAGISGDITTRQRTIIRKWLRGRDDTLVVLMGHHPYSSLLESAGRLLGGLVARDNVITYVSAHTHKGGYRINGGKRAWPELNIGSIVEWRPEYRLFQVTEVAHEVDGRPVKSHGIFAQRYTLDDKIWKKGRCKKIPDLGVEYVKYHDRADPRPLETERRLIDALLGTFAAGLEFAKTAESDYWPTMATNDDEVLDLITAARASDKHDVKLMLVGELEEFEKRREVEPVAGDDPRVSYRLCHALWASKYDHGGFKPEVGDSYVVFPPSAAVEEKP